ncbi:hypothetical protein CHS0354_019571 [Potamilus streckersoni]|uniref:TIR domain-containing protein n=1 Tax=Potamilus streckersoni TaxID=2493646 RepID=A0AAE0TGI8_9BIVA|nr:hypothetical protein CHS0354_019571 [Potamilus streckersoni]
MLQIYISCLIGLLALNGESRSCNLEGTSYICNNVSQIEDIPTSLTYSVQKVTLTGTDELSGSFPNGLFHDISWVNVTALSILQFTSIDSIDKSVFDGLDSLRYLSISSCRSLNYIHPEVFNSSPDIEALYFDGDMNLKLSVVENALKDKANKLKYLSLRYLQMETNEASFLGERFYNALKGKELICLDLSYANIAGLSFNDSYDSAAFYHLRYLNVSHSKMPCAGIAHKTSIGDSLPNLQVLDVSGCESLVTYHKPNTQHKLTCDLPQELKYYFGADLVMSDNKPIQINYEIQLSKCDCNNLEIWDFSSNNIFHINMTKKESDCFHGLMKLDFSKNGLGYISPSFLSSFPSLKIIDLSENQLHKMQDMDDFSNLLHGNVQLESLEKTNIAEKYRYSNNPSGNLSLVVNWNIIPQYMKIDFSDNPIECNCANAGFLKWAVSTKIVLASRNTLTCKYGHTHYPLKNDLYQRVEYDCHLSATIIKSISAVVTVIVSLIIVTFMFRRFRQKRQEGKDIKNLKKEIHNCQRDFNYIAFIPFSSHDNDFVETVVLHELRTIIKRKLGIDEDVICTGNDNFRPGMLVINEIHRCIGESLVVVPIITAAFIKSEWSQAECAVAIQMHRKV